ncbi:phage shock protein C (PspC) family protein [Corynebacterium uterequi]|uniref:Phage shock protein C (PspC) family protein n=2 Tax=Corynebacterium uterequi TaxID=1072256 RepID=A0A0G3HH18_9CORY|nr:phage shock protein C (PspC) family protein [Corynebacterium uterequi]
MWRTRAPRIPSDQGGNAHVAGVCEGMGVRYQIDPLVLRIGFVLTALLLGGGILAYLLAWLLTPRLGTTVTPLGSIVRRREDLDRLQSPVRNERSTGWILLIVLFFLMPPAVVVSVPFAFSRMGWDYVSYHVDLSFLIGPTLLILAWWGLHSMTPKPPAGLIPGYTSPEDTLDKPVDLSRFISLDPTLQPTPDMPDTAAHPLSDMANEQAAQAPKKSSWPLVVGIVVGILAILAAATVAVKSAGPYIADRIPDVPGDFHVSFDIGSEADLYTDHYNSNAGELSLDFSDMAPLDRSRTVTVEVTNHPVRIHLPEELPVEVTCTPEEVHGCRSASYNDDASGYSLTVDVVRTDSTEPVVITHDDDPGVAA